MAKKSDDGKMVVEVDTKHDKAKVITRPDVSGRLAGFFDFVREQGVVGLAIGLAIGTQATEFVKTIVAGIISPIVDLLAGKDGLQGLTWTVHVLERTSTFDFGSIINGLIRFLAVALVVYIAFKILKLDRLDKKKDK